MVWTPPAVTLEAVKKQADAMSAQNGVSPEQNAFYYLKSLGYTNAQMDQLYGFAEGSVEKAFGPQDSPGVQAGPGAAPVVAPNVVQQITQPGTVTAGGNIFATDTLAAQDNGLTSTKGFLTKSQPRAATVAPTTSAPRVSRVAAAVNQGAYDIAPQQANMNQVETYLQRLKRMQAAAPAPGTFNLSGG